MRIFKLLIAMFVVAVAASVLFNYQSFSDKDYKKEVGFCANCHEMKPYYFTWKATAHNQFGCLKCHKDIKITTFAYKHWLNVIPTPIENKTFIPDTTCQQCHTMLTRSVSAPGDLIIPHQLHTVKQVDCIDCHSNVTHAFVAEYARKTPDYSYATFSEATAGKLIQKGNRIPMPVCMRCHNGDMATDACNACHSSIKSAEKIMVKE